MNGKLCEIKAYQGTWWGWVGGVYLNVNKHFLNRINSYELNIFINVNG